MSIFAMKFPRKIMGVNFSRNIKEWFIKNRLRKKYAAQLVRNKELSIHTSEGWNDLARVNHSKHLIDQCIEPTEETLQKYQEEVNAMVNEMIGKHQPEPVPMFFSRSTMLYKNLWAEMYRQNISADKMAQAIGISIESLGKKLSGKATLYVGDIVKIKNVFPKPLDINYLFAEMVEQVEAELIEQAR
ncbi:MAG: hypothetical protein A4E53_01159 [Pelotomaculum sp. PtaB.Bin104]|nr:MAG: hypothetical protein A4E53_01159 [Pelotomaculum sp. PtaB.Bin104]